MEGKPPGPRPFGALGDEAVKLGREWMVYLGANEATVALDVARRVCDLYSNRFLAWVTDGRGNLDIGVVEKAAQTAAHDGRLPLIFLPGGVRPMARERADALGVALLRYRANDGALDGANELGHRLRANGLGPPDPLHD